ncbi:MAG TPA: AI-2E family transporter [Limnobacter sp.]|nr:AI-2E family transporter [Limnobacter sp.]
MSSLVPHKESHSVRWEYASVLGILAIWVGMMSLKIGVGLIAGLAIFALTRFTRRGFVRLLQPHNKAFSGPFMRGLFGWLPTFLTTAVVAAAVVLLGIGLNSGVRFVLQTMTQQGPQLVEEALRNLNSVTASLPPAIKEHIPGKPSDLFRMISKDNNDFMGYIRNFGGASFFIFLQLVFALILGVSAALMVPGVNAPITASRPLAEAWLQTLEKYVRCFTLLMGAQVYVSIWNTFCTAIFIYGVLPAFDVVLPFRELLLMFTAVASLIPAAGNIMANTLILVLTIRYGVFVALGSVLYLFVIHKLEYFVNGYIIGRNVRASVPEMLIAIILGEVAFGLPGLITAPVTYAFLKMHWQRWGWV